MEATVVSVAKSVLDGALGMAKSAVADEVALQLGVQRDLAFIKDEFDMMQTFLMAADEDRAKKKVVKTWVKQVRDLAYDAEDCLQDFSVHLQKPSWWRLPRTLRARHRIAKEIKELKARVEDVSQRSLRYRLIEDSSSMPASSTERSSISSAAIFGTDEPRIAAANQDEPKVDLCQLITTDDQALRVISVLGGANDDVKKLSKIREVYDNQEIYTEFGCRAWVKLMQPCKKNDFLQILVEQFYLNSLRVKGKAKEGTAIGVGVLKKMETVAADGNLIDEFDRYVKENRYLIVIDGLCTVVEWDWIETFFPDWKNGSRIIVSTEQEEIARLCAGQPNQKAKLNQLPSDQPLYLFYNKPDSGSKNVTAANSIQPVLTHDIEEDQSMSMGGTNSTGKNLARNRTMQASLEEYQLVGRDAAISHVIELICQESEQRQVISVCGMGGVGKTTLVGSVYGSEKLSGKFQKRAWVTVLHPFNREEFFRSLVQRLHTGNTGKDARLVEENVQKKLKVLFDRRDIPALIQETSQLLESGTYLIVLDDLSSDREWDSIIPHLPRGDRASRIIITTRDKSVASRCCKKHELESLGEADALDLFKKKVHSGSEKFDLSDTMMKEAKLILKKCDGLPLAIATIGGFLATKPRTTLEWRKLNDHISVELANNTELEKITAVLTSSYDGLPYHLKSCFLYLSIFPEDHNIRHGRLVRRWIAEGYSRAVRSKSAEEVAEEYFTDIINRSMIQPSKTGTDNDENITDLFQLHDLMREISISKSAEENLVLVLDEHCTLQPKNKVRHLVVSRSWSRDQKKNVLGSIVDMSHIRSLTVFGEWRSFFISKKMRLLRVLDLEDTEYLRDHDLVPIGNLRHLNYLSLRRCRYIYHLPDSFGNLSDLETLDIRLTFVITLPASIVKLPKLKYLRASLVPIHESHSWHSRKINQPYIFGSAAHKSYVQKKSIRDLDALPRLCFAARVWLRGWDAHGVKVPRGIGRLEALQTLGVVNISRGKAMLKELKKLTQLRKLGVTGINKKNCKELCSAIANHDRLRSLSMRAEGEPGLQGCLDDLSPPPNDLQSLKLYGKLVRLPTWIEQLQMLAKLTLRSTELEHDAMIALGKLPNLGILRLHRGSFKWGLHLHFGPETFASLAALELEWLDGLKSVDFEEKATPKLELLRVHCYFAVHEGGFSGIPFLSSLKEVSLRLAKYNYGEELDEHLREITAGLRDQVAKNQNKPHLKIED